MEPIRAAVCHTGSNSFRRRWEDIRDSDEIFITPHSETFLTGDSEDDEQANVGTQADTIVAGDTKDCCSGDAVCPTYPEIQQMLIESQNFTIRVLGES